MTLRKRPLPQTRQMRVLQNSYQISWPYYRRRQDDDGPWQTQWNPRLANPEDSQTSPIMAWIWKLLPTIYQRIFTPGTTAQSTPQERSTILMGPRCTTILRRNEETIH